MKILVLPKPIEGVAREELLQHAAEEIQAVWELYAQGICREFYTRANEPGRVVLMFESASVEAAKEALATLPFAQLHLHELVEQFGGIKGEHDEDERGRVLPERVSEDLMTQKRNAIQSEREPGRVARDHHFAFGCRYDHGGQRVYGRERRESGCQKTEKHGPQAN